MAHCASLLSGLRFQPARVAVVIVTGALCLLASAGARAAGVQIAPDAPRSSGPLVRDALFRPRQLSKAEVLGFIKALSQKQMQNLENVSQSIRSTVAESQQINLRSTDAPIARQALATLPERLSRLQSTRDECLARFTFFNQLALRLESQWNGQDLKVFLEQELLDMALADLTANAEDRAGHWRVAMNLSVALREVMEPREDLLDFLAGYVDFSSVREPKSPWEYLESRSYTNSATTQVAMPTSKEEAGSAAEKQLRALGLWPKDPAAGRVKD